MHQFQERQGIRHVSIGVPVPELPLLADRVDMMATDLNRAHIAPWKGLSAMVQAQPLLGHGEIAEAEGDACRVGGEHLRELLACHLLLDRSA